MNFKEKRSIVKLLKNAEFFLNKRVSEGYQDVINAINSINNNNNEQSLIFNILIGLIINHTKIKWDKNNSDKIIKIQKKMIDKNKKRFSEFILRTYTNDFNRKCEVWDKYGIHSKKYGINTNITINYV